MVSLAKYRKDKQKELEPHISSLRDSYKVLSGYHQEMMKKLSDFMQTEHVPNKVASRIVEENMSQMNALVEVHKAMYKLNDIANTFALQYLSHITEIYGDAELLVKTVELEIKNDDIFNKITTSNAERNREAEFITLYLNNEFTKIKNKYRAIKDLVSFVESMQSYLNRLDSFIRLKEKIIGSSEYEAMVTSSSFSLNEIGGM